MNTVVINGKQWAILDQITPNEMVNQQYAAQARRAGQVRHLLIKRPRTAVKFTIEYHDGFFTSPVAVDQDCFSKREVNADIYDVDTPADYEQGGALQWEY